MERIAKPEDAVLSRGYYKWVDDNGIFHKEPADGSVEVTEPEKGADTTSELYTTDENTITPLKKAEEPVKAESADEAEKELDTNGEER